MNNGFDKAVPPPEVEAILKQHSGYATRVRMSGVLGWDLVFPGRLTQESRRTLKGLGYVYEGKRRWCRWDADQTDVKASAKGTLSEAQIEVLGLLKKNGPMPTSRTTHHKYVSGACARGLELRGLVQPVRGSILDQYQVVITNDGVLAYDRATRR